MAEASVGPYRILERLGAGANGEVFLAEDTRLHRRVALKKLLDRGGVDPAESRRRLLREARAAARLNHPHIAAVHDVLETPEGVHIVMEYVRGTTLATRVRSGPLPPMQVLDYALQLSGALAHAHELGVIHRDLKPGNVMVSDNGQVKILDFGLARVNEASAGEVALSSSEHSTESRQIVGTPPYIPPEHLRGSPVDARGDVYSLGVTLFELLTGRRPFDAQGGVPLADAILSAPTPRPRSLSPAVPADLDDIVFRAMAREPANRHASARSLQAELQALGAAIVDPPTLSARRVSWTGSAKARTAVALGAVLLMGVAVTGRRGDSLRDPPAATGSPAVPPVVAVLPLANLTGDPSNDYLGVGIADVLTTSLARVSGINVVPRSSAARQGDQDARQAARELGADLIVEGAVHRSQNQVRVTVSVLRPGVNALAWSRSYEGRLHEILSLQTEVAEALATELRITLSPVQRTRVAGTPTVVEPALDDYMKARALLDRPDRAGNLEAAVGLFESAIAKDPAFAAAHAGLGEACWAKYEESKDASWTARAREATDRALELDPDQPAARYALALILKGTGRRDQAITELRRSTVLQPGFDDARRQLGRLLLATGEAEAGLQELRRAIAIRPGYWKNHDALGQAYFDLGRYEEALSSFRRVTDLQPDSAWGYQSLGTTYHAMGDRARAADNYRKSLTLAPDPGAYSNLGTLYYGEGRYREALAAYEHVLELAPQEPVTHRNLGDTYQRLGKPDRARRAYAAAARLTEAALRVNPRDALTRAKLAVYEAKVGRHAEAARQMDRALSLAPRDFEVLYRKAVVLTLAGEPRQAAEALRSAIANGFSRDFAREDEDLAPLRRDARYAPLFAVDKVAAKDVR